MAKAKKKSGASFVADLNLSADEFLDAYIYKEKVEEEREILSTGLIPLDIILGGGVSDGDIISLYSAEGVGKCHGKGTKILMYDGSIKNVEDIVVGDLIMGDDSTPRTVLSLARGRENMYKITPNRGGEPFTCNESHILSLKESCDRHKNIKKDDIVNISIREYLTKDKTFKQHMMAYRKPVNFEAKPVPYDPYIYGLWLGDGSTKEVALTTMDEGIVEDWINFGKENGLPNITVGVRNNSRCATYRLSTGHKGNRKIPFLSFLRTSLDESGQKKIIQDYMVNSREVRLSLLAGIVDSDGYVSNDGRQLSITSKVKGLAEDYVYLCRSLGFQTSIKKVTKGIKSIGFEGEYYTVYVSGNLDEIPSKLERRQFKPRRLNKDWLKTGFKIEALGEGDYYGFELDGNHLYLLGDFTVTHNTTIFLQTSKELINRHGKRVLYVDIESGISNQVESFKLKPLIDDGSFRYVDRFKTVGEVEKLFMSILEKEELPFDVIVIDSITNLIDDSLLTRSVTDTMVAGQAKAVTYFLQKFRVLFKERGIITFLVNQERANLEAKGPYDRKTKSAGCKAVQYIPDVIIRLRKSDKILSKKKTPNGIEEVEVGRYIIASADKNRKGNPAIPISFPLRFGIGISNLLFIVGLIKNKGYVKQKGAYFYTDMIPNPNGGEWSIQGIKGLTQFVDDNYEAIVSILENDGAFKLVEDIDNDPDSI